MRSQGFAIDLQTWFEEHRTEVDRNIHRYFGGGDDAFTGRWFEPLAALGDPDHFGPSDLVAVEALSVQVPPEAAALLLLSKRSRFDELLQDVPRDVDLWAVSRDSIGPESAAQALHRALDEVPGIGWVTAGKLMAAKRPLLIPVYDNKVRDLLNPRDAPVWETLRDTLSDERTRSVIQSACAGAPPEVSLLRRIDVALWMAATQPSQI